jgi:hypothetical protein
MKPRYVTKATGEQERFQARKFDASLKHAGAKPKMRRFVAQHVLDRLENDPDTEHIAKQALACLLNEDPASACRYHLKNAIMKLGPTGYPFEDYVGAVLARHGYTTDIGVILSGKCVDHEIDVDARKGKRRSIVECKFHGRRGGNTDVQVALYMQSRFHDVRSRNTDVADVWIVTNTRFTSQAVRYGTCAGITLISWKHPGDRSLKQLVETYALYPITIFPWLSKHAAAGLVKDGIVLAEQVLQTREEELRRAGQLHSAQIRRLITDAELLFS